MVYRNLLRVDCMVKHFAISSCGQGIIVACGSNFYSLVLKSSGDYEQPYERCANVVDNFFGDITGLSWRPKALEFATSCKDGSIRVWKLVEDEETGEVAVMMIWSSGSVGLAVSDAVFTDAIGLSSINRRLLKQRGAFVGIPSIQLQPPKV